MREDYTLSDDETFALRDIMSAIRTAESQGSTRYEQMLRIHRWSIGAPTSDTYVLDAEADRSLMFLVESGFTRQQVLNLILRQVETERTDRVSSMA